MADTSNYLNQENIYSYNSKTGYNPAVQQAALGNLINQYSQPSQSQPVQNQTNMYTQQAPVIPTAQQKQTAIQNAYNVQPSNTTYAPGSYAKDISAYANNQVNNSTLEQFFNKTQLPDSGYEYNIKPEYVQLLNIDKFGAPTMAPKTQNIDGVEQQVTPEVPEMFYAMKGLKSPQQTAMEQEQARQAQMNADNLLRQQQFAQTYGNGTTAINPSGQLTYTQSRLPSAPVPLSTSPIYGTSVGTSLGMTAAEEANLRALNFSQPQINQIKSKQLSENINSLGGIDIATGGDLAQKTLINNLLKGWSQNG